MNTATVAPIPRLVPLDEAQPFLGKRSMPTLYRMAKSGQIPARKFGGAWVISEDDLRTLCAGRLPASR